MRSHTWPVQQLGQQLGDTVTQGKTDGPHLCLCQIDLLYAVIAAIDVVVLRRKHSDEGGVLEVVHRPSVQQVYLLQGHTTAAP